MPFGLLSDADIADRSRHQNSFGAFERAQHDFEGKFAVVFPPTDEFDSGADLLCQCVRGASRTVGDQPFGKALRNDLFTL